MSGPGSTLKWQHLDAQGQPTPYYVPTGSPSATPNLSNNLIFPNQGPHITPEERLASMYPTKMQAGGQADGEGDRNREEHDKAAVRFEPTEAELQEQDAGNFTEEPPTGLSPAQQARWGKLYSALFVDNKPGEPDPQHKRARGELLKLQQLARMAAKGA